MPEKLAVKGNVEEGVILLTISFGQELLFERGARERLSNELMNRYREIREKENVKSTSCVVEIQSDTAGSPLVRALFELWKEIVGKEGGQVICVGYPSDYIDSLTSLGLPSLGGFSLANSKEEAFSKVKA